MERRKDKRSYRLIKEEGKKGKGRGGDGGREEKGRKGKG